jgi:hypothetical protein
VSSMYIIFLFKPCIVTKNYMNLSVECICVLVIVTLKMRGQDVSVINPLNAELNPICHFLALLGGATIVVISWLRVNM